jgi:hypothetical protein
MTNSFREKDRVMSPGPTASVYKSVLASERGYIFFDQAARVSAVLLQYFFASDLPFGSGGDPNSYTYFSSGTTGPFPAGLLATLLHLFHNIRIPIAWQL